MKLIEPWIRQRFRDMWTLGQPLIVMRQKKYYRLPHNMTWGEISEVLGVEESKLKELNIKLINIKTLNKGTIIVYPGRALNVSYTEEGLKWTANKLGKLLYFEDAFLVQKNGKPSFQGRNLKRSKQVIIEEFIPRDHQQHQRVLVEDQKAEYLWTNKGLRMLYTDESAIPVDLPRVDPNDIIDGGN